MKHVGPVLPAMLLLSLLTLIPVATRRPAPRGDLVVWVFSDAHAASFRERMGDEPSLAERFRQRTGRSVDVQQLSYRALEIRLLSMMLSPGAQQEVPDIVAIEISSVGKFFRAPVEGIGLLPLNAYLERSGWIGQILPARLAPYSKHGVIFGIPHDVHPVALAYRKDLFDEAGIDIESVETWPQLHRQLAAYQRYWRDRGMVVRHAIDLSRTSVDTVVMMLLQRGVNLIDDRDQIHFTDPRVTECLAFYTRLIAGRDRVGAAAAAGSSAYRDLVEGRFGAWFCPDWRSPQLQRYATGLAGKVRLRPLPRFDPGDAPTSTWGGTMFGIPRNCRNPDAAFALLEHLLLADEALAARARVSPILPPMREKWNLPGFDDPDPFWGGQKVGRFFAELAPRVPHRYVTPFTQIAWTELNEVLAKAVAAADAGREDELEPLCADWLRTAADSLRRRVEFGRFER